MNIVKMLCLTILLLTHSTQGAQCNASSAETPIGQAALQISSTSTTSYLGSIFEQIVTTDAIYLSMAEGEKVKIDRNYYTLAWAIDYGQLGDSMALSPDSSYLIAGSFISQSHLGILNSSDGALLASYSSQAFGSYKYIYAGDTRALCINFIGFF